jgi:CRISPR-associated protein Cas1
MKKNYYLFNSGELKRKDNSLSYVKNDKVLYIPIENVDNIYVFGETTVNSSLLNFLGKCSINMHYFDYFDHYTGSFYAKEYLLSGRLLVRQCLHYDDISKRLFIAKSFVKSSINNCLINLKNHKNSDLDSEINNISTLLNTIDNYNTIFDVMAIEGNCRRMYYDCFNKIIKKYHMNGRTKQPPKDEINCLMSFGNMMCYTLCLDQIYNTQLNPTISYLHEPSERRFSLSLDIAEVFKPILVDRLIFRLLNNNMLNDSCFDKTETYCLLNEKGKKIFVENWNADITKTFLFKKDKNITYQSLIKLECYKLIKHLLDIETYKYLKFY